LPRVWHDTQQRGLGFLGTLSGLIASAEVDNPGLIPDFRQEQHLIVASDYGGEHAAAKWISYTYLITCHEEAARWVGKSRLLRKKLLPDGRRMAFKRLGDRVRMRALVPFLNLSNGLRGLLAFFLVQRPIRSLFSAKTLDPTELGYEPLRKYPAHIAEKLLRITHLLALLIGGISSEGQDLNLGG